MHHDHRRTSNYIFKILKPATVATLRKGELPEVMIQFLDQLSGAAQVLNRSKNPIKAAGTMLADPDQVKPGNKRSYTEMFQAFLERRRQVNESTVSVPEQLGKLLMKYSDDEVDAPFDPTVNEEEKKDE